MGRAALAWMLTLVAIPPVLADSSPLWSLQLTWFLFGNPLWKVKFVSQLPNRNKVNRVWRSLEPSNVSPDTGQALAQHQAKGKAVWELMF